MIKENKRTGIRHSEEGRWLGNPRGVVGSMRCGTLFFLLLFCLTGYCQRTKKDSVAHFRVAYKTGDYKFFPADGHLFLSSKNKLKISNSANRKFDVTLVGGAIKKIGGDSIFEIDGLIKPGNVLLCLYEKDLKGKRKMVASKPLTVVNYPKVKFAGVTCDSAMPAIQLAAGGMSVYYTGLGTKVPVTSFKMEYYEKDKFVLDSSNNNRLSKKMLAYVEKLKPGSLVYMTDIKYKDPNGAEHREPIYRVFIISDKNVLKFGVD